MGKAQSLAEKGTERVGLEPITVDARTAARLLGVAPQTLANWRCRGEGPVPTRYGRRVVYRVDDLRRYADEHASR